MLNPNDQPKPTEPPAVIAPAEAIAGQVLSAIGKPDDFLTVKVRLLWTNHYRVNVLTGTSDAFAKVAHSYFLVARDGVIENSVPTLRREYGDPAREARSATGSA